MHLISDNYFMLSEFYFTYLFIAKEVAISIVHNLNSNSKWQINGHDYHGRFTSQLLLYWLGYPHQHAKYIFLKLYDS